MELELSMLDEFNNETIASMTGINVKTIKAWREMMGELRGANIRTSPAPVKRVFQVIEKKARANSEKELQSRFVKTLDTDYQEYVRTKYGIIDVLTQKSLYELKIDITNSTIQKPVGQVILYSFDMPNINKVIVAKTIRISEYIEKAISSLGIRLLEFS
jgi:hypothetical protein